jgi:hypothetical protein
MKFLDCPNLALMSPVLFKTQILIFMTPSWGYALVRFRSLCLALAAVAVVVVVVVSPSFVSSVASRLIVGRRLGLCPCKCRWTLIARY